MYGEYMYGGEQVNVHKVIIGSDYKGGIGFPDTLSVSCVVKHVPSVSLVWYGEPRIHDVVMLTLVDVEAP